MVEEMLKAAAALAAQEATLAQVVTTWLHPQNREWEATIDALVDLREALSDLLGGGR